MGLLKCSRVILFCVILGITLADDACIAACDSTIQQATITICGTDLKTHITQPSVYSGSSACYMKCGVGLYHVGPCGCPNWCYNDTAHGTCNTNEYVCECAEGWGGKDCSQIVCPSNICSGHGTCGEVEGKDGCICESGWTSSDCSVAAEPVLENSAPFSQVTSGKYYKDDKYEDEHPVFRPNLIGTVKMNISTSDMLYCLYPQNLYNQTWVYGDFVFDNGIVSKTISNVGIRIKGAVSRSEPKKSWSVKINTEKGRDWKGLKGVGLKMATGAKVVSNQLVIDFYRSMMVQTYRTSFVEFWLNDIYMGLYTIQEKFDDNFVESRWNVKDAYLYKIGWYDMSYKGDTDTAYQALTYSFDAANPINCIEQSEGDGDWTSFVQLVTSINDGSFSGETFDINSFVRAMALEAFTQNMDGYNGIGNNYFLANTVKSGTYWEWVAQDFDQALSGSMGGGGAGGGGQPGGGGNRTNPNTVGNGGGAAAASGAPATGNNGGGQGGGPGGGGGQGGGGGMRNLNTNVLAFPVTTKPLTQAIFALPNVNQTYVEYFRKFINVVFVEKPGVVYSRLQALTRLATPIVAKDKFYTASSSQTLASFVTQSASLVTWLSSRAENVTLQIGNVTFATQAPTEVPTPTSTPDPTSSTDTTTKSSSNTGKIAGIVVGSIFGCVLVVGGVMIATNKLFKKQYTLQVALDDTSSEENAA